MLIALILCAGMVYVGWNIGKLAKAIGQLPARMGRFG
jgi:hypothetical protein